MSVILSFTMGYKEEHWYVHEECIVYTVVWQKAPLWQKQHQTVKNSSRSLSQ